MDVAEDVRQYLALKDQLKLLTDRQNEIKNRLIEAVDLEPADDRGHRIMTVDNDAFGTVSMTRQRRVSKNLDMDIAEAILTNKGIKDQCIKMVPMIDESAIMSAFYENYLTEEDIDAMFPAKVSYAFIVDNK